MAETKVQELPVVWLPCAACTGCSVSVLNSVSPTIKNVLVDEVIPGKHVSLKVHPTVMAGAGDLVVQELDNLEKGYVLVVEGAIPTKDDGVYGEFAGKTMIERLTTLAKDAVAILALGTCASYGGIPAGSPNPTGCKSVSEVLKEAKIATPVVNIPGCPPHPDWFVGTVASVLIAGLPTAEDIDDVGRPKAYYGQFIHDNCPRRGYFDENRFAKKIGDPGCLNELGCKGPVTHSDCATRKWLGGVNWCIGAGSPCIGCCEPGFPDLVAPMYEKIPDVTLPNIGKKEA